MEEEKTILTDEEVDQIIEAANKVNEDNDSINKLQEAKEKDIDELLDSEEEEDKNVVLTINPETGMPEGTSIASGYGFDKDTDLFDDFLDSTTESFSDEDITEANIQNALAYEGEKEEASITDIYRIKELLINKNKSGGVKYNELPEFLKKKVDVLVRQEMTKGYTSAQLGMVRNMLANEIMDNIYTSILQDKLTEVSVDLETSIKNLVKEEYSDINSAQIKQQQKIYTEKLVELADTKYKDDPEKRKLLLDVSEGYKQAYTLEKMYSAYSNGGKKMKVRKIDIEKLHKLVRDFECKYENSTFTLRGNIMDSVQVLSRHVNKRFSENTIKAFIAVFCKYTWAMKPSNIAEHTFMYYFVSNILGLDLPVTDKEVQKFNNDFVETVNHFLSLIDSKINN